MPTKMKFVVEVGLWDRRYRRPVRLHTVVRVETGQDMGGDAMTEAAEVMQEMLAANMKAMWGEHHPFHTLDVEVQDLFWGTEAEVTLEIYDTTKKTEVGINNESQLDIIDADPMAFLGALANEVSAIAAANEWLVAVALKATANQKGQAFKIPESIGLRAMTEEDAKALVGDLVKDPRYVTAEEVAKVLQQAVPLGVHASVGADKDTIILTGGAGSSAIKIPRAREGQGVPPAWKDEDDAV